LRSVTSITASGTSGAARYVFVPNPLFGAASGTLASTTWTMAAAWANIGGGSGFITTNAKELRITSFGIIVRSAMSATTAKGLVILSTDPAPIVGGTSTSGSMQATDSCLTTLAAGLETTWVSKPLGPTAHHFKPISSFTSTMSDFDWSSCVVEVSGSDITSAITMLTVEYVLNVEFTVATGNDTTAVAQLQRSPPPANNVALAAAAHSHSTRPSIIQGGIDKASAYLERQAKSSLDSILSEGMSLLFAAL